MGITPFDKSYQISKQETIDKLERASKNVIPLNSDKCANLERHKSNTAHILYLLRKLSH